MELATAMPSGSPRQCAHCPEDIAIGSPCARNEYGTPCHPQCANATRAQIRARTHARAVSASVAPSAEAPAAPSANPTRDRGDEIADALDALLGRNASSAVASTAHTEAPVQPIAEAPTAPIRDRGDEVADALDALLGRTGATHDS